VTTHLIGDWIIRESSEPFQRKENERSTPIEQLVKQEKKIVSNESIISSQSSLPNVKHWTVSDYFVTVTKKSSKVKLRCLYERMINF
jgi:hypothetical protein